MKNAILTDKSLYEMQAEVCKTLTNPKRIEILNTLQNEEKTVTELVNALGVSTTPAFILIKVSPIKRIQVYDRIRELAVSRAFRIAGEVDALIMVERENLDEILKKLYAIDGIQDTRSYVTIEIIK